MNRLVIIGNGFDLGHGLPTRYCDFIDDYWRNFIRSYDKKHASQYSDHFAEFKKMEQIIIPKSPKTFQGILIKKL